LKGKTKKDPKGTTFWRGKKKKRGRKTLIKVPEGTPASVTKREENKGETLKKPDKKEKKGRFDPTGRFFQGEGRKREEGTED